MKRLSPLSRRQLITRLQALGFDGPFSGGKHQFMSRNDIDVHIPNPHQTDLGVALLKRLLRQAGVSQDEWHHQ
ncbi:MAG: type II toxin-antitoxin system HicA family toxin [Candidatus Peregrinibacteria bacterium]